MTLLIAVTVIRAVYAMKQQETNVLNQENIMELILGFSFLGLEQTSVEIICSLIQRDYQDSPNIQWGTSTIQLLMLLKQLESIHYE